MSELQEVVVRIAPDGTVKIDVHGAKGAKCRIITEALERALGGEVVDRTHTHEYDEAPNESAQLDYVGQEH